MCSNYETVTSEQRLLTFFGADRAPELDPAPAQVWPLGLAPFIRAHEDGSGNRVVEMGQFGMMPAFQAEIAYGRRTYNARTETVDKLVTYRDAWAKGWRCIIPAEGIYEPCYESGSAVRWRIQQPGGRPMGIAGIYRRKKAPDGSPMWSFSMLTVNADGHPVFQRMHKPQDEKRMVVILSDEDYAGWLACSVDAARGYWRQWPGHLDAFPAPLPPRTRKPAAEKKVRPGDSDPSPKDLF